MFQDLLWMNPLVHVTATMRTGIFGAYDAAFVELIYVWGISATLIIVGLYMVRRHRSALINPRF
jgi:capsular polysaccharide transport system permease protein